MAITDKHTHILKKAEELFAAKGFDGTSVRDIADAAGVNLAMISYYFGSKEKLMESLFRERMDAMKIRVETIIENKTLKPYEKIETLIDEYINKVIEKQSFHKIMICEQLINKNTIVLKHLKELKLGYARLISELIAEGQQAKVFKQDVDVMLLLNTMTGTATQMVLNREYYKEFNNYKKMPTAELNELIIKKLRTHIKNIYKAILGYGQ
jgi:AcrR family transcriptional regulator